MYCELGKHFLIPKNLKEAATKELEDMNLLKREDRDNFIILEHPIDLELDREKILKNLKMF